MRLRDNKALLAASKSDLQYLIIYIFEPFLQKLPDFSIRHWQFVYHSILDMNKQLEKKNNKVNVFFAEAMDVFSHLASIYSIKSVYSYQESGVLETWNRDKLIKKWSRNQGVFWVEFQTSGVLRGIKNRVEWDKLCRKYFKQ